MGVYIVHRSSTIKLYTFKFTLNVLKKYNTVCFFWHRIFNAHYTSFAFYIYLGEKKT